MVLKEGAELAFDRALAGAMIREGLLQAAMPQSSTQPAFTDESGLIARAKRGDSAAFTQLVDRYGRKIFRLAKHIIQNEEDAEDVLQDTFLKAYEHLGKFQEQSRFYTWIVASR
jgi:RNA polymerase sigma-70 factor (ECF subfamily)